jgi:hypothetical protein
MAVGDVQFHNKFLFNLASGDMHLDTDTFRCYLLNGWTPNIDTNHYLSDISANEIALSGYTAGGVTLSGKTLTEDDTNDRTAWDFDNPTWASIASGSISRAAIIHWTGTASTSTIVCNIEVSNSNGQSYTITIPSGGILLIRQAA